MLLLKVLPDAVFCELSDVLNLHAWYSQATGDCAISHSDCCLSKWTPRREETELFRVQVTLEMSFLRLVQTYLSFPGLSPATLKQNPDLDSTDWQRVPQTVIQKPHPQSNLHVLLHWQLGLEQTFPKQIVATYMNDKAVPFFDMLSLVVVVQWVFFVPVSVCVCLCLILETRLPYAIHLIWFLLSPSSFVLWKRNMVMNE